MNYFLRNFPNPLEAAVFARVQDEQQLFDAIRREHSELLVEASKQCFGQTAQLQEADDGLRGGAHAHSDGIQQSVLNANVRKRPTDGPKRNSEMFAKVLSSLDLAAAPSSFGANALAQAIVYRLGGDVFHRMTNESHCPEHWLLAQLSQMQEESRSGTIPQKPGIFPPLQNSHWTAHEGPHSEQLVGLGLDCVFSVLLELNRRDPELCAQSLQSLLQLLQNMEPESLATQSRPMTVRMHDLLRELRREGNASVSAGANACMMSLAVASSHPDILFSTVAALLCEPKRHLPHNQISADSNPLPRNFQLLAQSAQRLVIGGNPRECSWLTLSLEKRPSVCEFDVIYTGSALMASQSGGETQRGGGVQGCLVSDGAFIFLLTQFGLLKMGTGLSETRAGEVLHCNELLKFSEGSALFVSNESLYLRRRHSSRLWVLDTDNLREIGEIMLPSALTSQGILFADGRQFWHAQLDEQWHLSCTALDDSFGPQQDHSPGSAGSEGPPQPPAARRASTGMVGARLMETEFCAFGEMDECQQRLLQTIPAKLRAMAADLQLGQGVGFLLLRNGKVFYAGPEAQTGFDLPPMEDPFCWTSLAMPETVVSIALEPTNRTLILRSGAGNLWLLSGTSTGSPGKTKSPRKPGEKERRGVVRRLKVPNKRKCMSISVASVGGGCLAYATENGRCFLLGRHVLNSGATSQSSLPSAQCSPIKQTASIVHGLEGVPVAQVALGKTHLVAIGKNGVVYATGLNNQNQCGRAQSAQPATVPRQQPIAAKPPLQSLASSSGCPSTHSSLASSSGSASLQQFCASASQHLFLDDLASLCVRCGLCSVRGAACPFGKAQAKGSFCPCARPGPSCCLRCGLCKNCAEEKQREKNNENGFVGGKQLGKVASSPKAVRLQLSTKREMLGLSAGNAPLARDELVEEETKNKLEETKPPAAVTPTTRIFAPERVLLQQQPTIKVASVSVGNFHTVVLSADNQVYTFGANTHGQLGTGDTMARAGAHKLALPANVQVVQAVAGANHTVLRTLDGRLITFGAHKAGQLGRKRLATPAEMPTTGQSSPLHSARQWFAEPGFVPVFGQAYGRLASWVGAQGDQTLVQVQRQLLSRAELAEGRVTAAGDCLLLMPGQHSQGRPLGTANKGYLLIRRTAEGKAPLFRHFQWENGILEGLAKCSYCLDPKHFNLLWAYDPQKMCVFALSNAASSSLIRQTSAMMQREPSFLVNHRQLVLRCTELMVPSVADSEGPEANGSSETGSPVRYSDCQLGLFLLATIHSLCLAAIAGCGQAEVEEDGDGAAETGEAEESLGEFVDAREGRDCRMVNRFENFGGGWGYSAHCVEALQFKANRDILFCGVGLFGGRGEYTARLKLFRVLDDAGAGEMVQQCVELLAETDEVLFECPPRETAVLQLERPIQVGHDRWHVVWVQITGPSSDCGAGGQAVVRAEGGEADEDAVEFHFRPNTLSNNGTNVEVGQIPELYFLTPSDIDVEQRFGENQTPRNPLALRGLRKPKAASVRRSKTRLISAASLFDVRPKALEHLLAVAEWALLEAGAFLECGREDELLDCDCVWRQERAALVGIFCLRLIRLFLCALPIQQQQNMGTEERLGIGQVVAFHQLLKNLLRRKVQEQDQVGTFVLTEAVSSYVNCAFLFAPSHQLLKARLSEQLGQVEKNWWLLALLCSLESLNKQLLPILGLEADQEENSQRCNRNNAVLVEALKSELPEDAQLAAHSPHSILHFLFELAFAEMPEEVEVMDRIRLDMEDSAGHGDNKFILQQRLNASALKLLSMLSHQLVAECLPPIPVTSSLQQPPQQTPSRFRHVSAHAQWEVGGGADSWDAIGLRVETGSDCVCLQGVGIFSGVASGQGPHSVELEFLQNKAHDDWRLLERVCAQLDSFPTQSVHFTKTWPLRPEATYALRVRFEGAGKTLFGEGGLSSIQLPENGRFHFLPCSMSKNGTTVARGQFPFLLYSIESKCNKEVKERRWNEQKTEPFAQLFLQLLRLLVRRISQRMVHADGNGQRLFKPGEQSLCAALLGHANLLVENRPALAFEIVTVLDEAIPILAHVNSTGKAITRIGSSGEEDEDEPQMNSSSSEYAELTQTAKQQQPGWYPIWAESAHPYSPGQLIVQQLEVPMANAIAMRFDPQCRTAQPTDSLWIYAACSGEEEYFPVGHFTGRSWPRGSFVVPGNRIWILFESGPREEAESSENCFGFRCSIAPIAGSQLAANPNHSLEHHFVWCLANVCRQLLLANGGQQQLETEKAASRELLNRHALLARRGIRFGRGGTVPALSELMTKEWRTDLHPPEWQFLSEFAESTANEAASTAAAILASALCFQPIVHLAFSQLRFLTSGGEQLRVGKPIELQFQPRDQHNREVVVAEEMDVFVLLNSGDIGFEEANKIGTHSRIDWARLKTEHMKNPFRPVPAGRALFQCISMQPPMVGHSFEELRFAFAFGQPTKERIRLQRNERGTFSTNWTPRRAGLFTIQCYVDNRPLANQSAQMEVFGSEEVSTTSSVARVLRVQNPVNDSAQQLVSTARPLASTLRRAHFSSTSPYFSVRIRAHPSLGAAQIGQVPRGNWLEFTEVLRNGDGIWLRLSDASSKEMFGEQSREHAIEAWVLQLNAHLQTEYLKMAPPSNGNFFPSAESSTRIASSQQQPITISILDSPKFRKRPPSESPLHSPPQHQCQQPALGPALLEALRCTFCALAWHAAPGERWPTVEDLEEAANWLRERPELAERIWEKQERSTKDLPPSLRRAMSGWREMSNAFSRKCRQTEKNSANTDSAESAVQRDDPTSIHCELCGGQFTAPICAHMRQCHPGCGKPSLNWGYNSAGQWTTGWNGNCGEGGDGSAVWYLLCGQCRERQMRSRIGNYNGSKAALPSVERLKRNAQFLLTLNRHERVAKSGNAPILSVDPYPEAGPSRRLWRQKKSSIVSAEEKWHASDPGDPRISSDQHYPQPFSISAAPNFYPAESESLANDGLLDAVIGFVTSKHDLNSLRTLLRQSLQRTVCFGFAFRLWNWLIKLSNVEDSAYDVIWHFLATLHHFATSQSPLLPHPAQLCLLAGQQPLVQMVEQFHGLLQQLAMLLQNPSEHVDGRLRRLCFRAWTFQLTGHEQALLPTIRALLSTVGNLLSCSSADTAGTVISNSNESTLAVGSTQKCSAAEQQHQIQTLEDMTECVRLEASSRQQLLGCLLDGSCETFWESGEEDRGRRQRLVVLIWGDGLAKLAAVFLDNARDEGFRVERFLVKLGEEEEATVILDRRLNKDFTGWIKFAVAGSKRLEICIWGDEMGCRLRQIRLLGFHDVANSKDDAEKGVNASSSIRPSNSQQQLLFGGVNGDAFALFQSLATQVFGDEFAAGEENGTLREQVLDLLFSRSQLQPLQSFVGTHVSNAVEREVSSLRTKRKRHFSYASALLQMLVRMCSTVPPAFLPNFQLLSCLSQLWLFAPDSVQLQALEAAAKLLGQCCQTDMRDDIVAELVEHLLVLVAKAASLQVKEKRQRCKAIQKHTLKTHAMDNIPQQWFVSEKPTTSVDAAQFAIHLLREAPAELNAKVQTEVASHVMRVSGLLHEWLTKGRPLAEAIRCPQFWLALSALGTMDGPGWLENAHAYQQLRAEQSRARDPLCENHDDGRTRAQLRCQTCALSLCRECFAVLHLSRRNQTHRARLVGSSLMPLPRADFHEGCHRLRIGQQLLVLLNPKSLAGLVELGDGLESAAIGGPTIGRSPSSFPSSSSSLSSFRKSSQETSKTVKIAPIASTDNGNGEDVGMEECREESEEEASQPMMEDSGTDQEGRCRFCGIQLTCEQLFTGVCDFEECRQKQEDACPKTLRCGHWCSGIRDEQQCPPCLHCPTVGNRQDADDLCAICYSERLGESSCLQLHCQHVFHWNCLRTVLEKRWPGPRISFRFMHCPLCKAKMEHPALEDLLAPLQQLEQDVAQKARLRLEYEGHLVATSSSAISDQNALLEMALAKYIYVQCSRCAKAYFGGDARCQQELEAAGLAEKAFDPAELVCGSCAAEEAGNSGLVGVCGRHGTDFLEFKCRFCCSVAMYFCFGSTHFCAACHGDFQRLVGMPKHALPKCPAGPRGQQLPDSEQCPLRVAHPPAGEEFALGCGICRNLHTF